MLWTTHIPSLRPILCLCHIVPALTVSTEKDDFVMHALLAVLVEVTHVLFKTAPLLFRVVAILGFSIRFLILPVYETKVLLFLASELAPGELDRCDTE